MSGREVRESLYGCSSYSEFKMKLGIMGFASIPGKDVFILCHMDDWKWEIFMSKIEESVNDGETELWRVDEWILRNFQCL